MTKPNTKTAAETSDKPAPAKRSRKRNPNPGAPSEAEASKATSADDKLAALAVTNNAEVAAEEQASADAAAASTRASSEVVSGIVASMKYVSTKAAQQVIDNVPANKRSNAIRRAANKLEKDGQTGTAKELRDLYPDAFVSTGGGRSYDRTIVEAKRSYRYHKEPSKRGNFGPLGFTLSLLEEAQSVVEEGQRYTQTYDAKTGVITFTPIVGG